MNSQVTVGAAPLTVIGNSRIRDAETGIPKNKVVVGSTYTVGRWVWDATFTRFSSYRYNVGNIPGVATANGNIDPGVLAGELLRPQRGVRAAQQRERRSAGAERVRQVSRQICARQSLERHQPVFVHCAERRVRSLS